LGKRSDFPRRKNDSYPTPYEAVIPLLPFLRPGTEYVEPCCGGGQLIRHLEQHGHLCTLAVDINPTGVPYAWTGSAFNISECDGSVFITNPPWTREILHPMIAHLSDMAPTWLLFDASWAHTKQARPYLARCTDIVAVGRVKWIPDSKFSGKDDCAWYRFDREIDGRPVPTRFWGRA